MDERNTAICGSTPKDPACDIVKYATSLDEETHKENMANVTVGKQPGYTKVSVDGVMKAF